MMLQPNDTLRRGDILCQKYSRTKIGSEWFGKTVKDLINRLPAPELVIGIERPIAPEDITK